MTPAGRILIATIGAPHGVRGEVRLNAHTDDPSSLTSYGKLSTADGRSFRIERLGTSGAHLVARLKGIANRDEAAALTGTDLYVDRTALPEPEPDEFYQADLIGLAAETVDGAPLGTVIAVQNYGAGDLLEIAPPTGAPILVPFTRAVVPTVDLAAGKLIVDPPPGLLEGDDDDNEA